MIALKLLTWLKEQIHILLKKVLEEIEVSKLKLIKKVLEAQF